MKNLLYLAMLFALGTCPPVRAEEPVAAPPTPSYDVIRLKAGPVLAGNIIGYSTDSILMKVFGVERAYAIAGIEDLKTRNDDPDFRWTVWGAALKGGNVSLALSLARGDRNLADMILGWPKFEATLEESRRAGETLDRLLPAQARTAAERERALQQMEDFDAAIVQSQQIIADPYYYENATVTRTVLCSACGGRGFLRWAPLDFGNHTNGDRFGDRLRACPNCQGAGVVTVTNVEQVQRTRNVNAEAAKIIGWRAERDKLAKAVTGYDRKLTTGEEETRAAREAQANAEARLVELCRAMAAKYFPDN